MSCVRAFGEYVDDVFSRCCGGHIGMPLVDCPGKGPSVTFATAGLCHALGCNYWEWRGTITAAMHGFFHFRGRLTEHSAEGEEMQSYQYDRTLCLF